jgi:hypothetical protein
MNRTVAPRAMLLRGLVCLVVVAVVGVAVPASAAVPGLVVVAERNFGSGEVLGNWIPCPGGRRVIGGGFDIDLGHGNAQELRPGAGPNPISLFVGAQQSDPWPRGWEVNGYALCVDPLPGLVVASAFTPSDSTATKLVFVRCPAGKRVVGTGYEARGGGGQVIVDDVVPGSTSVYVGANEEEAFTGNWSLAAYAVCADPLPGLVRVSATISGADFLHTTAYCPTGKVLLGTGFEMRGGPAGTTIVEAMVPWPTAGAAPTGLRLHAEEEDPTEHDWTLTAYAICADA